MGALRHTCICLCAKCESLGSGAFGAQPCGAEPLRLEAARPEEASGGMYRAAPLDQKGDERP